MAERLSISNEDCIVERDGPVVIITMNRPEKRNALSATMLVGLADAYDFVDATDDIRCAVLTGAGGHFSSGMDLVSRDQPRSVYVERRMAEEPGLHWKGLLRDYRLSKPLIAAV
ncbi:MAG: crotonase/enoyl-CoA hydratase family protein, partial [Actinobacteria bacterium]